MRKTTFALAILVIALGLTATLTLRAYKVRLIHLIVENAVLQKAPADYPEARIRNVFESFLRHAEASNREDHYLERLLQASQRLEKVQQLDARGLEELFEALDPMN